MLYKDGIKMSNRMQKRYFMRFLGGCVVLGVVASAGASGLSVTALNAQAQPAPATVVDASTMKGKVMCGYQGWFNTPDDGAGRGWVHWGRGAMVPGKASVEYLPDVSELDPDEKFKTGFTHVDGSPVEVYSAFNPKTVARHFRWMQEYGVDGVFLQRFASGIGNPKVMVHYDRILDNVRKGAAQYGRAYGLMYDLSGLKVGEADKVINDFKAQVDQTNLVRDKQYIRENGKPVVVIWGIGFGTEGKRPNLFADGLKIVEFLKNDPKYGGNTVMVGVPHWWRDIKPKAPETRGDFEKVLAAADIVQPWGVGSFSGVEGATRNAEQKWAPDLAWCKEHGKEYMPVLFPGFSWNNLKPGAKLDQIPRLGGRFMWQQFVEAKKLDLSLTYVAMFDEVDEGTAIMKVTNDVPADGASRFLTLHGLPSDHYLKLVGEGARLMRGEMTPDQESVVRNAPPEKP